MTSLLDYTPGPPDYRLPWADMTAEYPWLQTLAGCPQDPIYHAEGDVWIHTRMVCEELLALDAWRALDDETRRTLFAAAALHDIGKPDCTKEENGRITSRGHSRRGTILGRNLLWLMAVPFALRELICALIRYHQVPYFLIDRGDSTRLAIEVAATGRGDLLAILAEADVRGRICADQQRLLDNVTLCREQMRELGVLDSPYPFATDHARVLYFKDEKRHPDAPAFFEPRGEVVLMSGLPGAGKDHTIREHFADWAIISLDELRAELDILPGENQGDVLNAAREQARAYLRAGTSFVWNATNLARQLRTQSLELFLRYGARVRIVYVEAPAEVLFRQNRAREAVVPERVMDRFRDRWEVPDATEAHSVEFQVHG
jgi:predicted kinase